jgi:hypothetical protein
MSYSFTIPPEYLGELVAIREATGISIRMQILIATVSWIKEHKEVKP